jgi:hypothetical protein
VETLAEFEDILAYQGNDFDEIRAWLVYQVDYLLTHNTERLQWVLYRIDIDELKLKKILLSNEEKPVAEIIADLIIARQIEKYQLRKQDTATGWSFDV